MIYYFLLYTLINNSIGSICPSLCNCGNTLQIVCTTCLVNYYRIYDQTSKSCPCRSGFKQSSYMEQYCCPQYCLTCNPQLGCLSCRNFWILQFNGLLNINECVCAAGYAYNSIFDDCICQTTMIPAYYSPMPTQCIVCPQTCNCSASQCLSCTDPNRIIQINIYQKMTCYCNEGMLTPDGLSCTNQSQIQFSSNTGNQYYVCDPPYVKSEGTCICVQPYYVDEYNQCSCKSQQDPINYFQFNSTCYVCPSNCICGQDGCVTCNGYPNFNIIRNYQAQDLQYGCFCAAPYTLLSQVCVCLEPYDPNCNCLSITYPSLYFSPKNGTCYVCPQGCVCNGLGCISCTSKSNRNITDPYCGCINFMTETNGSCVICQSPYILINLSCQCDEQSSLVYLDPLTNKCLLCPDGCQCNINKGCYFCNITTFRTVVNISNRNSYCYCTFPYTEDSQGICKCNLPFTFNQTSNSCQCNLPYFKSYYDQSAGLYNCLCSSFTNLTAFSETNICQACPVGCICGNYGCIYCDTSTHRAVVSLNSTYKKCPCIKYTDGYIINTIAPNGTCIYNCSLINYYVLNGTCVKCSLKCLSCNIYGCVNCSNNYTLTPSLQCSCGPTGDPNLIVNEYGNCACISRYFTTDNLTCIPCSLNCRDCIFSKFISNQILITNFICTSCQNSSYNRLDNANSNCPCIEYYNEGLVSLKQFCCHQSCLDCDLKGCISCISQNHRVLNSTDPNNVTCSCEQGFVEFEGDFTYDCVCPKGYYLLNNNCQNCPVECQNCKLINDIYNCTLCNAADNRIQTKLSILNTNLTYYTCTCLPGFSETVTGDQFCSPQYCIDEEPSVTCINCKKGRVVTEDGKKCVCAPHYFEDSFSSCVACPVGCLNCTSSVSCSYCDQTNNYQLLQNGATSLCVNYLTGIYSVYQSTTYTVFVININKANQILQCNLELRATDPYRPGFSSIRQSSVITSVQSTSSTIYVFMNNPQYRYVSPYIYNFTYITNPISENASPIVNVYLFSEDTLYSQRDLVWDYQIWIYVLLSLAMVISLLLYLTGFKHNRIMFFLQTLHFLGYNIGDPRMLVAPLLFSFRFIVMNINSTNLFNLDLQYKQSQGNYQYFTLDDSMIRNGSLVVTLAAIVGLASLVMRMIYEMFHNKQKHRIYRIIQRSKKIIYRTLEFLHKLFMYPVVFYSIETLSQSHSQYYEYIASVVSLVIYLASITISQLYEDISRLYKLDNWLEISTDILSSLIIANTAGSNQVYWLALIMIMRGVIQILARKECYSEYFEWQGYLKLGIIGLEIMCLVFAVNLFLQGVIVLMAVVVVSEIVVTLLVFRKELQNNPIRVANSIADTTNCEIL